MTPSTRLVYLTSPNNPTGLAIPTPAIVAIARRLPPDALLLLDEAYVEFGGESFIADLAAHQNVVVGRTFAKAYGLAGMRVGAVVGARDVMARLRGMLPPYSLNVFVVAALGAAIERSDYLDWYRAQVAESKRLVYDACDRLGLHYWPSDANFVLVRVGPDATGSVGAMAGRGIFVRDRYRQPGCAGCVRITAGLVAHTGAA